MRRQVDWRWVGMVWLLGLFAGQGVVLCAEAERPEFAPLLYLPFDGSAAAGVPENGVTVTGQDGLKFAEGKVGKAVDLIDSGCVELRGLPALNLKEGTMELWVKSAHDGKEMEDHCYLQFLKDDGSAGMEVKFYHVELSAQVRMWEGKRTYRRYGWGWAKDAWQQFVVTWNSADPDLCGLGLYLNGIETGYPATYGVIQMPDFLRVGCQSPEEGHSARALIDEVCIYNRSLTRGQVKTLFENGNKPLPEKVAAVRERIARDEATEREQTDQLFNHRKLAMLHGRNTSLLHWKDEVFTPLRIPVPDKIHETMIAKTDLKQYDMVIVPGGGGLNLSDADKEALHKYVREGGGYVGICGGAVTAQRYGLISADKYAFGVRGSVWTMLKPHPITDGYDLTRKLLFPHASGPLFVIKEDSEKAIVLFDVGNPPLPSFSHTIVKQYGKGRIVVFSGHPESSSNTRLLLRNAILWTAKVTGIEDAEPHADVKEKKQ